MNELTSIGEKGTEAVKKLRLHKLRNGLPFMINSSELVSDQCYLEFPDGSIKLATFKSSHRDFNILRNLTQKEAQSIRARYQFYI